MLNITTLIYLVNEEIRCNIGPDPFADIRGIKTYHKSLLVYSLGSGDNTNVTIKLVTVIHANGDIETIVDDISNSLIAIHL